MHFYAAPADVACDLSPNPAYQRHSRVKTTTLQPAKDSPSSENEADPVYSEPMVASEGEMVYVAMEDIVTEEDTYTYMCAV